MSDEAKSTFERGKSLFEQKNYDEALSAFAKAVHLDPQNAEYRAWFARTLVDKNSSQAIEEASRAIQLDPTCSLAYRVRGRAYLVQENFPRALEDTSEAIQLDPKDALAFQCRAAVYSSPQLHDYTRALEDASQAIQLDPKDARTFRLRAYIYSQLQDYQNSIADSARQYELTSKDQYTLTDKKFAPWLQAIHKHFTNTLLPQTKSAGERFVEYWPCYFMFGKRQEQSLVDGWSYQHIYGTHGTGYLCLTDRNIRLVSLRHLTERFPGFKKPGVIGTIILGGLSRQSHHIKPEKEDRLWIVPNQSVSNANITEDHIDMTSPVINCEISQLITGDLPIMLAGIHMAMSGKLAKIWTLPQSAAQTQPDTDVIRLLKQLGDLRSQGIITEEEFEQKKKELLARL